MKDLTEGRLEEQLAYAKSIGNTTLQNAIDHLKQVEEAWPNDNVQTNLSNDFAERSFYFERTMNGKYWGNGGILFHEGNTGAGYPFAVELNPDNGPHWATHT